MATVKLALNELSTRVAENHAAFPLAKGKQPDSKSLIKQRMAEVASKKAQTSPPQKRRKKEMEDSLALLLAQLPVDLRHTETAEKMMAFCQLGINATAGVKAAQSHRELPVIEASLSHRALPMTEISSDSEGDSTDKALIDAPLVPNHVAIGQGVIGKTHWQQESNRLSNTAETVSVETNANLSISANTNKNVVRHQASITALAPQPKKWQGAEHNKHALPPSTQIKHREVEQNDLHIHHETHHEMPIPLGVKTTSVTREAMSVSPLSFQAPALSLPTHESRILPQSEITARPMSPSPSVASISVADQGQYSTPSSLPLVQPTQSQKIDEGDTVPEISQPYPQLEIDDSPDWVIPPLATTTCNEKGQIAPMVQSRQPTNKANSTLDMGTEAMAAATENKVTQIEGSRLTYTFNQWQNSPSVTFELATRGSELLATTTSPEVHRALHENQHLLRSDHPLSIRDEESRHERQRQQRQQQSEQEDH
ncbi:type III secretion protein [Providencia stuartii]|nr:type III secretion protein [Providencia stuartii]MTB79997.1 type III secretion protein [Providencia stuartii]